MNAQSLQMQDGVIVQHHGPGYLFIFPPSEGRLRTSRNPAGQIDIGKSVRITYALEVVGAGGKARFIGLDGSQLPANLRRIKPILTIREAYEHFGFLVKDTVQPMIHIHYDPAFVNEDQKASKEKVAREGNLTVILAPNRFGDLRILRAILD